MAVAEGGLDPRTLVTMADLLTSKAALPRDRPTVVKTTGMGWEDLVVAVAAYQQGARPE